VCLSRNDVEEEGGMTSDLLGQARMCLLGASDKVILGLELLCGGYVKPGAMH
jgi:hypothetical protein